MFLRTIKGKGWSQRLKDMPVGQVVNVVIGDLKAAREAISRGIPNSGVEMKFKTKTKKELVKGKLTRYGEIKRIE